MCKWKMTITDEEIDDLMSSALEGGVTAMWCLRVCVGKEGYLGEYASEQISRGGELKFVTEDGTYTLNKAKLLMGIQTAINEGYIEMDDDGIDWYMMDAIAADAAVQCGLFGEVVYG